MFHSILWYEHISDLPQPWPRSEAELEAAEAQLEAALEAQQQATARYEEAPGAQRWGKNFIDVLFPMVG